MLTFKFDDSQIRKAFKDKWDVRDATRSALNNVVQFSGLEAELKKELRASVDRPTPFTVDDRKPFYVRPVGKGPNDPLVAKIGVMGRQASYLQFMVKGVPRDDKIIERKGPNGAIMTPTKAIKLNAYGNVPKNEYLKIFKLAQAKADGYFWQPVKKGRLPAGIYKRTETGIIRQFTVANPTPPKRKFDFFGIANRYIKTHLKSAVEEAIRFRMSRK